MLTVKKEKFIQELIKGKTQRQAYKEAYNCTNMADETIDNKASKLFAENEVRARYKALLEKSSINALWTREKSFNERMWLLDRIRASIEIEGIKQYNGAIFNQTLRDLDEMTFNNDYLKDEKQRLEIEQLRKNLEETNTAEDRMFSYIDNVMKLFKEE